MEIDDVVTCWVEIESPHSKSDRRRMKGKIVYIHPRRRFVTVEFNIKGTYFRNCFFPHELN